ncbi:hypothetical protein M427DRAFT_338413 [Gonapodya prolifera JEL478]|uniref:Uncharacterized protein n=1 Tax=Gonapodya prolifera (strain JEL478) TaxID=1344416 RepID=A0A139ACI0_GONPJ|nr:hypothetical protein M427DRAFT_338413 [Gonapodya prolifera JEL478]|eukprot:KXS14522.1 hypothetical protein M427DRAFT_338413 [Gonapodya prolifera JEL478]
MAQKGEDYTKEGGVVKDDSYILNEEEGGEEYTPDQDSDETRAEPPELRESSKTAPGTFAEDESPESEDKILGKNDGREASRRVEALVAASHRKGRTEEEKRKSAEKASELYEEETGYPLEINKKGEVVTGPPDMK